jgi:transcriptional regulator with XRE-family HTH domain
MKFGQRLKYARGKRRFTQEKLADLSKVSQATISALEKRGSERSNYAGALADALDVPLEWLLHGKGQEPDWDGKKAKAAELSPEVIEIAKKIAAMDTERRKLLMELFTRADEDDPRPNNTAPTKIGTVFKRL